MGWSTKRKRERLRRRPEAQAPGAGLLAMTLPRCRVSRSFRKTELARNTDLPLTCGEGKKQYANYEKQTHFIALFSGTLRYGESIAPKGPNVGFFSRFARRKLLRDRAYNLPFFTARKSMSKP